AWGGAARGSGGGRGWGRGARGTVGRGPAVPLKTVPMITSPRTSKSTAPVSRFTRAWPSRVDHANVAALTLPTELKFSAVWVAGLSVAVITPTTCFQRASAASADDVHSAASTKPTNATLLLHFCFITDSFPLVEIALRNTIADSSRRSRGGGPWMSMWRRTAVGDGSVTARTRRSGHDRKDARKRSTALGTIDCRPMACRALRTPSFTIALPSQSPRGGRRSERSAVLAAR